MLIDKDTLLEALEKECQLADSMDEIKVVLGLTKAIYIVSRTSSSEPESKPLTLDELRERNKKPVYCKGIVNEGLTDFGIVNTFVGRVYDGNFDWWEFSEYGKTWLAYDREVKGDNDGEIKHL